MTHSFSAPIWADVNGNNFRCKRLFLVNHAHHPHQGAIYLGKQQAALLASCRAGQPPLPILRRSQAVLFIPRAKGCRLYFEGFQADLAVALPVFWRKGDDFSLGHFKIILEVVSRPKEMGYLLKKL